LGFEGLTGITWVHVFEEDTPAGAVFRREDSDIPLARRPRERITLHADGTAVLMTGGADDRFVPQQGRWREEAGVIVVRDAGDNVRFRIVEHSANRLVVRIPERPSAC
jgi:hypothetical protein